MSNPERRIHELQEEILFQRVLLSSIDDTVQNRAQAEQDVKDEIHSLQRQLVKLKRGTTADLTTASTLSQPASSQRIEATPRSSSPRSKSASNAASMEGYPGEINFYLTFFFFLSCTTSLLNWRIENRTLT